MAPRQAAAANVSAAEETSEREYQTTINAAVAGTEDEIFRDALGDDELDNDADTSLEDMGDGLEGEATEEGDEAEEGEESDEAQAEGEQGDEAETAEGEEADVTEERPRDQRGQFRERQPAVPPGRLREETQRARAAEERSQLLERQLAEMNGRMAEISARMNAPQQRQVQQTPPPKPDMFAEPERYEAWLMAEAERRAETKVEQRFGEYQRQQSERETQRLNIVFNDAATGPRGWEFMAAYNTLMKLDPNDSAARATVTRIAGAPDPVAAMIEWFDSNGGDEYREQVFSQLAPRMQQRQNGRLQQNAQQRLQVAQARHEIRPGRTLPSLNSATGSNVQRVSDPEMFDGSERSIFDYGSRRG